jgi:dUTP pyrophosphatase
MIQAEYVLAHPDFIPTQAVDQSAGFDLRAYLSHKPPLDWDTFRHPEVSDTLINGKPINYTRMTNQKLVEYDPLRRFIVLAPGERLVINAGFKVKLSTDQPNKIATMLICPRSGLAINGGISVINSPGIVDEDYPDWVGVGLVNHSHYLHLFSHGTRIAQAMFIEVEQPIESIAEELTLTGNRTGGFGSTGI